VTLDEVLETRMREIAREEAARPEFVHQRSAEKFVGVSRRQFLRDAHAKHFASTKAGRLIVARTAEVLAHYELRIKTAAAPAANDADAETIAFARVGARRVAP
jgi:hypothetical protein